MFFGNTNNTTNLRESPDLFSFKILESKNSHCKIIKQLPHYLIRIVIIIFLQCFSLSIPNKGVAPKHNTPFSLHLPFRRIRIVAVWITFTNLPLSVMDKQLRSLIFRNLFANLNSFSLRIGNNSRSAVACAFHLPSVRMWRYMLISRHNHTSLSVALGTAYCTPVHVGIIRLSFFYCFSARVEIPQIYPVVFRRKIIAGGLVYFVVKIRISWCQLVDIIMMKHVRSPLSVYFIKNTTKRAIAWSIPPWGKKICKKPWHFKSFVI